MYLYTATNLTNALLTHSSNPMMAGPLQRDMQRRGGVQLSPGERGLRARRHAAEAEARRTARRVVAGQPERALQARRAFIPYYVLLEIK